jgi:signal transduction histidine kinase
MSRRVIRKWRPTLGLVVFVVLTTVVALPLVGLVFFRLYENQLVRQAEGELIAQSAVIAAVFSQELASTPEVATLLGAEIPIAVDAANGPYHPIEPSLDLMSDPIREPRPASLPPATPSASQVLDIGAKLGPILVQSQNVTLAGFRVLDAQGNVIAGRNEGGMSLAHIQEVKEALHGRYKSVLRQRIYDEAPPPLYSISRGTEIRVFTAMPVVVQGRVGGVVYASRTPNNIVKYIYGDRSKFALAAFAILAATLAIGFLFWRTITRPIHALVARAAEVGRGKSEFVPLDHHGTHEIALLSQSFADMAERLKERSDYIATFAAHVSHELKTPLTSIQGAAELLRDNRPQDAMSPEQRQRFLDNIVADTARLATMLDRLRDLARAENTEAGGTTDTATAVDNIRATFPALSIAASGTLDDLLAISAENLSIVLSHLADNASRHSALELQIIADVKGDQIEIIVRDDGDGISEGNRGRVFDNFFTTRRESGGTGMGLGIVQALLRVHGGSIRLVPSEEPGAMFAILIPRATPR